MARMTAALSVLAVLLAAVVAVDDPAMLLTLVGAALCVLSCAPGRRSPAASGPAVVVPGRRARRTVSGAFRQHHPDSAGRPRPRAPGGALPVI